MHIIGTGRDAFLEFLRNLTPQALLFSAAVVLSSKIKEPILTLHNIGFLLLVLSLVAILFFAAAANTLKFLDNAFSGSDWARAQMTSIKETESAPRKHAWLFLKATWREHPVMFIEFVVAIAITYSSLIAVLIMATSTALKALK